MEGAWSYVAEDWPVEGTITATMWQSEQKAGETIAMVNGQPDPLSNGRNSGAVAM